MPSSSSSSSFSSDDDSELSSGSSSTNLEDGEASFVPYDEDLEPLATAEEAATYEANMALEEEQELEFQRRFTGEVDVGAWCTCSNCSVVLATKAEECICCQEIERVEEIMSAVNQDGNCVTLHPSFQDVCLNRWVLEVASLTIKTKAGKSYRTMFSQGLKSESEFLRAVSYRQFSRLLWDFAGHSKRYPLPCCVYEAVRTAFPSENGQYHGFEDDES